MYQSKVKHCQNCQRAFSIESEDFEFYGKIKVPTPSWCPECRIKRRMSLYNVKTLYRRKCDLCQKSILAIYPVKTEFPVYCPECWWSDKWEAAEYFLEYDFSKNFFIQYKKLQNKVPRVSLEVDYQKNINSSYANDCGPLKNCYLVFLADSCEDTMYSMEIDRLKYSMDCANVSESEQSYELFNSASCYKVFYSQGCIDCLNVYYSRDLKGCSDCFGCVNLRNKQYYIFNKKYNKKEYFNKLKEFNLGSWHSHLVISDNFRKMSLKLPFRFMSGFKNDNVSGDNIFFSKDVHNSFLVIEGQNIKHSQMLGMATTKDCYDYTSWGQNAERVYESVHSGDGISNVKFSIGAWRSYEVEYSDNPLFSNNLFGCIGLRNKQYCILNKQYSQKDYFKVVKKIKKHMNEMPYIDQQGRKYKYGEFFPPELSLFAYNETIAQEYFPLTKGKAKKQGYCWKDREKRSYQITIKTQDLPDHIDEVDNFILKEVIQCQTIVDDKKINSEKQQIGKAGCTTAFRIIPQELEFYKKYNIPLPRYCPNCRHYQRLKNRNALKLYKRTCQKEGCNVEFETTYAPDRSEIVYCEKCYQERVV